MILGRRYGPRNKRSKVNCEDFCAVVIEGRVYENMLDYNSEKITLDPRLRV